MKNNRPSRVVKYPVLEQGSEEWLQARRQCTVTTSEFGAAMGICQYQSRAALVRRKLAGDVAERANFYMQMGSHYEDYIARAYAEVEQSEVMPFGMLVAHYDDGLTLGCSPDRAVLNGEGEIAHLVEIKYTHSGNMTVPFGHLAQMLGQQVLFEVPFVDYVKWAPNEVTADCRMVLNICRVQFAPELWTDYALPALRDFHAAVQRQIPCDAVTTVTRRIKEAFTKHTVFSAYEL